MQGLAFIGIDRLTEKCREVFFATEDFSEEAFNYRERWFVFCIRGLHAHGHKPRDERHISRVHEYNARQFGVRPG